MLGIKEWEKVGPCRMKEEKQYNRKSSYSVLSTSSRSSENKQQKIRRVHPLHLRSKASCTENGRTQSVTKWNKQMRRGPHGFSRSRMVASLTEILPWDRVQWASRCRAELSFRHSELEISEGCPIWKRSACLGVQTMPKSFPGLYWVPFFKKTYFILFYGIVV